MPRWDDLDCTLAGALIDFPPPEAEMQNVTPWKDAVNRIIWGICLICFTLNFWYLQYLLPLIGSVLLYFGFRALRTTNRWFRYAWILSGLHIAYSYALHLLLATPLISFASRITLLNPPLLILTLLCFRQGFLQLESECSGKTKDPVLPVLIWYVVLIGFAVFCPNPGWIVLLGMIFAFWKIIQSLHTVSAALETTGYTIHAAPVRVSNSTFLFGYFGSLTLFMAALLLLFNHIPLNGTPVSPSNSTERVAVVEHLSTIGFPSELTDQLLTEDLLALRSAVTCCEDTDALAYEANSDVSLRPNRMFFFQMEDGSICALHLFQLDQRSGFWLQKLSVRSHTPLSDCTVRLFYQQFGSPYAASLFLSNTGIEQGISYFGDPYQFYTAVFSPFSWPLFTAERHGYSLMTLDPAESMMVTTTIDRAKSFQYPYGHFPAAEPWIYSHHAFWDGENLAFEL